MKKKMFLGLAVGGVCLWLALRGIDWSEVGYSLRTLERGWILVIPVMMLLTYIFRARRHQVLLRPIKPVSVRELLAINAVGFLMIHALPFRIGEVTRPLLLKRRQDISFSSGLATVAVERVFDGLVATLALFLGILTAPIHHEEASAMGFSVNALAISALLLFVGTFAFLLLSVLQRARALRLVAFLTRFLPHHIREKVLLVADRFFEGLKCLPSLQSTARIFLESIGVWGVMIAVYWFGFQAFDLRLPWGAPFTVLGLSAVGVMLPAAPGFVGTFQIFVIAALAFYGVPKSTALAYSLVIQTLNLLFVVLIGLAFLPAVGMKARKLFSQTVSPEV